VKHYPEYINITIAKLEEALTIYQSYLNDSELICAIDIGRIYLQLGFVYDAYVEDIILANSYYDLGIASCILSLQTTVDRHKRIELCFTMCLLCRSRITNTHDETQRQEILLHCIKHLKLQLEELLSYPPSDHSDLLHCIYDLAELQNTAGLIIEATMNYEKLVQIYLLPNEPNFSSSSEIYGKISALTGIHQDLADIYVQLYQYKLAHENLITAKQFYEQSACYEKEKKIKVVERQIRDIEEFVIEDYGLRQLFIMNKACVSY